jgi:hypothetical protein
MCSVIKRSFNRRSERAFNWSRLTQNQTVIIKLNVDLYADSAESPGHARWRQAPKKGKLLAHQRTLQKALADIARKAFQSATIHSSQWFWNCCRTTWPLHIFTWPCRIQCGQEGEQDVWRLLYIRPTHISGRCNYIKLYVILEKYTSSSSFCGFYSEQRVAQQQYLLSQSKRFSSTQTEFLLGLFPIWVSTVRLLR